MNKFLKTLIVWMLLLAMPVQGFAAATMQLCAPLPAVAASQAGNAPHDHMAMMAAQGMSADDYRPHAGSVGDPAPAEHHADEKCNSCDTFCDTFCSFGLSMAPSYSSGLPVMAPRFESIPFTSGHQPLVDLAVPERPPRFLPA